MPFNLAWLIAGIGAIIAIMIWARTKRVGPAVAVFAGGIVIMMMADPSMLTTLAEAGKRLLQQGLDQGINN